MISRATAPRQPAAPVRSSPATAKSNAAASAKAGLSANPSRLPAGLRLAAESSLGHDFSEVRIHSDRTAAASAASVGARAFTVGPHIVFGAGQYCPTADDGRRLLVHELVHVAQQRDARALPSLDGRIAPPDHPLEREAEAISRRLAAGLGVPPRSPTVISTTREPLVMRTLDPRLQPALDQMRLIAVPLTPEAKANELRRILAGINLRDSDNMNAVVGAIDATFAPFERGPILTSLLGGLDTASPPRSTQAQRPTALEQAEMQRRLAMFQVPRRGPWGQVGPGVLLPELSQPARHLVPAVETAASGLGGARQFVTGLLEGAGGALGPAERDQLATRMSQSSILNVVFSPVFLSGAVVGIVDDVIGAVKGIYSLITDFGSFVSDMRTLLSALFGPDGQQIAHTLGTEIGRDYGARVAELARSDVFTFTFGIGRMIGPTIVYTVLGLLGVPELLASALIARLMEILGPLLERFPRLLALLERVAVRLARTGRHASIDELDRDLERSFAHTFTEHGGPPRPGAPTPRAPELAAGFQASHLGPLRRLLGRALSNSQIADLGRVWAAVANPGEAATLTLQNSRRLFNNQRGRFWRLVRSDAAAARIFTDAGFEFAGEATTAPTRTLADGSVMQATIDHIIERQTDPTRALDPANLRIVSRRENTVLLRQLHAQSPFL